MSSSIPFHIDILLKLLFVIDEYFNFLFLVCQTTGKNTITSVLAGKALTLTTSTGQTSLNQEKSDNNVIQLYGNRILKPAHTVQIANKQINNNIAFSSNVTNLNSKSINNNNDNRTIQSIVQDATIPSSQSQSNLPNIQIQQQQQPTNQIIMTSSGCQILLMPPQNNNKNTNQMIIGTAQATNANAQIVVNNTTGQQNVVLNTQNAHMIGNEIIQSINDSSVGAAHSNIIQNSNNNVVIQSQNVLSGNQNIIQPPNNVITANNGNVLSNNNSNYIVSSPNTIQPTMLINNSNLLSHNGNVLHHHHHHHHGPNVIVSQQGNANNILTTTNTKVLSNAGNILSPSNIITNQSNVIATTNNHQFIGSNSSGALLSPNNGGIVLNQLSNASYVIQPQSFTTVDGQVVNVINSDNNQFVQQQQTHQRIILSPDSKRRIKKRKSSSISPQSDTTQSSPTLQNPSQQTAVLQITPQYHQSQSFQTTIEVTY